MLRKMVSRPKMYFACRLISVLSDVYNAFSPKAAIDSLEFVKVMCRESKCPAQPACRWKRAVARGEVDPPRVRPRGRGTGRSGRFHGAY